MFEKKAANPALPFFTALCMFLSAVEYAVPKPLPFMRLGLANVPLMLAFGFMNFSSVLLLAALKVFHDILLNERNRGAAVLFISAELQEIMAVADRIIVLYSGQIMGDLDGETADQNVIGQMMLGQKAEDIK